MPYALHSYVPRKFAAWPDFRMMQTKQLILEFDKITVRISGYDACILSIMSTFACMISPLNNFLSKNLLMHM